MAPCCCLSLRFGLYTLLSLLLGFAVVQHAYHTREQFYPAVLYLFTSKFSMMVLINLAVVFLILLGLFFQQLFLGRLEPREEEVRLLPPPFLPFHTSP
jgi:E3 ubiquitin-protein ligase synoviolin